MGATKTISCTQVYGIGFTHFVGCAYKFWEQRGRHNKAPQQRPVVSLSSPAGFPSSPASQRGAPAPYVCWVLNRMNTSFL